MTGSGFKKLFTLVLAAALVAPLLLAGCGGSSPEGAVNEFLKAWQELDWEALKASVAPQHRELTKEQDELAKIQFEQAKVVFEGLKMETVYSEEDEKKAAVVLTEGKITYTVNVLGEEKTETKDISTLSKEERTYATIEVDEVWYVDKDLP
jgi:outer membrane murein-binding lipoprotein Lpp